MSAIETPRHCVVGPINCPFNSGAANRPVVPLAKFSQFEQQYLQGDKVFPTPGLTGGYTLTFDFPEAMIESESGGTLDVSHSMLTSC